MKDCLILICALGSLAHAAGIGAKDSAKTSKQKKRFEHRVVTFDEDNHNEEFWTFVTRPDLDAPRWNIQVYDEEKVTDGYWFVAPYEEVEQEDGSAAWNAPHIYDRHGELVWSGAALFEGFSTFDFRVSEVLGQPMLSLIRPHSNHAVILNETYGIFKEIYIGHPDPDLNEMGLNMHEFMTIDSGTKGKPRFTTYISTTANPLLPALFLTCVPKHASRNLSAAIGYDGECHAVYDGFVETDINEFQPKFTWNAYEHIGLDESYVTQDPLEDRCGGQGWDFVHLNSIDKFPNGDYLLSGRRTYTIYKISGKDGSIIWRLGGRKSDFQSPITFGGQHAAKIRSHNDTHTVLSLFDNAFGPGDPETTNDASRALVLALNENTMTVDLVQEFRHPHDGYAEGQGNVQYLPSTGHFWTCWRDQALHTEHDADGALIMEANFEAGVRNYRSFKFPWIGRPTSPPDVRSAAAQARDGSLSTIVSVSWNGATEVRKWKIFETNPTQTAKDLIATVDKSGFETTVWIDGYVSHVVVEAVGKAGDTLGEAAMFATVPTLDQLIEAEYGPSWFSNMINHPVIAFIGGIIISVSAVLGAYGVIISQKGSNVFRWRRGEQPYESVPKVDADENELDDYKSPLNSGRKGSVGESQTG
jgi:hypothetical protein